MLIYHPALDAYHCVFRMLAITQSLARLEFLKLRILDFYMCFPAEVAAVQLPEEHIDIKKVAKASKNEYRGPISSLRTFQDMEPIHVSSGRLLAASGLFDLEQFELGIVLRTNSKLPESLATAISEMQASDGELRKYILTKMSEIPLSGIGGLKKRTGLMEYRYDVA